MEFGFEPSRTFNERDELRTEAADHALRATQGMPSSTGAKLDPVPIPRDALMTAAAVRQVLAKAAAAKLALAKAAAIPGASLEHMKTHR